MKNMNIFLLVCAFFLSTLLVTPSFAIDDMEEDDGIDLLQIPLVDTNGQATKLADYHGKYVLLNFMFTTCHDVCPIQTASLIHLQGKLSDDMLSDVQFVSITLDPENDSAEDLLEHAEKYKINKKSWSFLTGSVESVRYITTRYSAISHADDAKLKEHNPRVYLLDKEGGVLLSYRTDPLDVERVESDLIDLASL